MKVLLHCYFSLPFYPVGTVRLVFKDPRGREVARTDPRLVYADVCNRVVWYPAWFYVPKDIPPGVHRFRVEVQTEVLPGLYVTTGSLEFSVHVLPHIVEERVTLREIIKRNIHWLLAGVVVGTLGYLILTRLRK